jgi:hypothetical protein
VNDSAIIEARDIEAFPFLGYGEDDRWYVLGEPTNSPELVLAAMLMVTTVIPMGEA